MADKIYTSEQAYSLNRAEQEEILTNRGIKFSSKDKEAVLVKEILRTNPKNDMSVEDILRTPKEVKAYKKYVEKSSRKCKICSSDMLLIDTGAAVKEVWECQKCFHKDHIM